MIVDYKLDLTVPSFEPPEPSYLYVIWTEKAACNRFIRPNPFGPNFNVIFWLLWMSKKWIYFRLAVLKSVFHHEVVIVFSIAEIDSVWQVATSIGLLADFHDFKTNNSEVMQHYSCNIRSCYFLERYFDFRANVILIGICKFILTFILNVERKSP